MKNEMKIKNKDIPKMIVIIRDCELDVYEDGTIKRKLKSGKWKEINNKINHNKGYNVILINKKQYMRSSIIAHVFLELNLDEKKYFVSHQDLDRLNCQLSNLRLVLKKVSRKKL